MIGERENNYTDTNYGSLIMRTFDIDGNNINAFYDAGDNLIFVLDNAINAQKPNVLLVINPDGDKKWDEILSSDYGVDLETIRPKVDNKYQKLDIEYSGLNIYENLINAYNAGDALDDYLNDLMILRDSAMRHSAMMRLNSANETIAKTNATIIKTKESVIRLEARIKTLRSKLSSAKKEIGRVNTKQSASKILKLESQIEAANEKLKRAKKRLESAQKRLEVATVDAELASNLLSQPQHEIKQSSKNKPVMVAPEYPMQTIEAQEDEEEFGQDEIKPLFDEDPQILNENIAFKPIIFDAPTFDESNEIVPVVNDVPVETPENKPVLETLAPVESEPVFTPQPIIEEDIKEKPVLETIKPVEETPEPVAAPAPVAPAVEPVIPVAPAVEPVIPVAPIVNNFQTPVEPKQEKSNPGFLYYMLLIVLILLSVFTLWLYQKNMGTDVMPVLTAKTSESQIVEPAAVVATEPVATVTVDEDSAFLDEEPVVAETAIAEPEPIVEPEIEEEIIEEEIDEEPIMESTVVEPVIEETVVVDETPVVIDAVPGRLNTSGINNSAEEPVSVSEDEILAAKPVYEPGAKYDNMFVNENDMIAEPEYTEEDVIYYDDGDVFYDTEEAVYPNEMNY